MLHVKNCKMITSKSVSQGFVWPCKKNLDDKIHCTKCDFSNKSTSYNPRWAWISCDFRNNKTSTLIWIRHNHISNYTFHTSQPLDVSCFKLFKTTFKREFRKKKVTITNKYSKFNKIRLSRWGHTPLDQTLLKKISNLDLG